MNEEVLGMAGKERKLQEGICRRIELEEVGKGRVGSWIRWWWAR
jgi:hypothetical protein